MIFPEFFAFVGFCLLSTTVKVFIGYILRDLDLQDSEVLTRQKETTVLADNNYFRRLKLNSSI